VLNDEGTRGRCLHVGTQEKLHVSNRDEAR
jgi:hypothetical protein